MSLVEINYPLLIIVKQSIEKRFEAVRNLGPSENVLERLLRLNFHATASNFQL